MGEYVDLPGGTHTWYEHLGSTDGDALVLLHGGLSSGDGFAPLGAALAERFRVLVPDRAGHGHTPDVDRPLGYERMTGETIEFLEAVVRQPAHLVGWSDGGNVALHAALQRPDLVRSIVVIGANFRYDGVLPEFIEGLATMESDSGDMAMLREGHQAVSPDGPEHWPVIFDKTVKMWAKEPALTVDDLATIDMPALVMVGDDDMVAYDHTVTMFESLPQGQLAVIPGTSHVVPLEKPALVAQLIADFVTDSTPIRMMPIRKASPDAH